MTEGVLSSRERAIAERLAEVAIPAGAFLPGGGPATVDRLEKLLDLLGVDAVRATRAGLWALESWAVKSAGRPLSSLPIESRARVVVGLLAGFGLTFAALLVFQRALPALPMLSVAVVLALAPQSLQVPVADRKKGFAFAGVLTALAALRLAAWAGFFDRLTNR